MEWFNIVTLLVNLLLFIINLLTFFRNGKKDQKSEWKNETVKFEELKESNIVFAIKLDQVCSNTQEICVDIKSMNKDLRAMESRISSLERDNKTLFHSIEKLEQEVRS